MKKDYIEYLLGISRKIESVIYSHYESVKLLKDPGLFGYTSKDEALDKVYTIISVWSKEDVDTYSEFIARHRDTKLNEIGI